MESPLGPLSTLQVGGGGQPRKAASPARHLLLPRLESGPAPPRTVRMPFSVGEPGPHMAQGHIYITDLSGSRLVWIEVSDLENGTSSVCF